MLTLHMQLAPSLCNALTSSTFTPSRNVWHDTTVRSQSHTTIRGIDPSQRSTRASSSSGPECESATPADVRPPVIRLVACLLSDAARVHAASRSFAATSAVAVSAAPSSKMLEVDEEWVVSFGFAAWMVCATDVPGVDAAVLVAVLVRFWELLPEPIGQPRTLDFAERCHYARGVAPAVSTARVVLSERFAQFDYTYYVQIFFQEAILHNNKRRTIERHTEPARSRRFATLCSAPQLSRPDLHLPVSI